MDVYSLDFYRPETIGIITPKLSDAEVARKHVCSKAEGIYEGLLLDIMIDATSYELDFPTTKDYKFESIGFLKGKLGDKSFIILKNPKGRYINESYDRKVGAKNALVYFPEAHTEIPKLWICSVSQTAKVLNICRPFFDSEEFPSEINSFADIKDEVELIVELLYQSTIEP